MTLKRVERAAGKQRCKTQHEKAAQKMRDLQWLDLFASDYKIMIFF